MRDKQQQRLRTLAFAAFSSLLIVMAATSFLLLGYCYVTSPQAFNSDDLLCSAVCDDLLHGRDMTGWYLPGAPYLFPDVALLAPCQWLTPHVVAAFWAYAIAFHLCLAGVLLVLGRMTGLSRWQASAVAGGGVILLAASHLDQNALNRAYLLFHAGSHTGVILVGLALLALVVRSLRRGQSLPAALVFLLMGALGAFSDRLLIAQVLAPLALGLLVLAARRLLSVKQAAGQLALLAGAVVMSFALRSLFQRLGLHLLHIERELHQPSWADVPRLLGRLYSCIQHETTLLCLLPLHLLVALVILFSAGRPSAPVNAAANRDPIGRLLTAFLVLLSPLCIIGALIVMGATQHPAIDRYTLSCWFFPTLLLPLLLSWLPGRFARAGVLMAQFAVVLIAVPRIVVLLPRIDWGRFQRPYPPLARELDRLARQRGLVRGLAGFWLARSTNWFTREPLIINPIFIEGEPWFHASNSARFLPDESDDLHDADCHFLLVRPGDPWEPSPAVLELAFGTPSEKIEVGSEQIWLYDSMRVGPFDRFLRSRLAERLHTRRPFLGPAQPACLAQPKSNLTRADAGSNLVLEEGQTLEVRYAQPITGRVLDVGAAHDNRLDLDFYHGEEFLGTLIVPSVPWTGASFDPPGIQSRLLPLPAALRDHPWDRIRLSPRAGCSNVRLGHLLVFTENVPGLEEVHPSPYPARVRLEGESLLPIGSLSPYREESDASASGGRVRRAAAGVSGPLGFTPMLTLPPGRYRLRCALQGGDNMLGEEVVQVAAWRAEPRETLTQLSLCGRDFSGADRYALRELTFEVTEATGRICFGAISTGKTSVALDYFDLIAEPAGSSFNNASAKSR